VKRKEKVSNNTAGKLTPLILRARETREKLMISLKGRKKDIDIKALLKGFKKTSDSVKRGVPHEGRNLLRTYEKWKKKPFRDQRFPFQRSHWKERIVSVPKKMGEGKGGTSPHGERNTDDASTPTIEGEK